jgi:hypothetical protein
VEVRNARHSVGVDGVASHAMTYSALPGPMLARAESTPPIGDYAYEVKCPAAAGARRRGGGTEPPLSCRGSP